MTTPKDALRKARQHLNTRSLFSILLVVGYCLYALFITAEWIQETLLLAYRIGQG